MSRPEPARRPGRRQAADVGASYSQRGPTERQQKRFGIGRFSCGTRATRLAPALIVVRLSPRSVCETARRIRSPASLLCKLLEPRWHVAAPTAFAPWLCPRRADSAADSGTARNMPVPLSFGRTTAEQPTKHGNDPTIVASRAARELRYCRVKSRLPGGRTEALPSPVAASGWRG